MSRQICRILKDGKDTGAVIILDSDQNSDSRLMSTVGNVIFLTPGKYELIASEIEKE